jgi:prepilin-type N-terminal cleavage/methylation domain-containing protein
MCSQHLRTHLRRSGFTLIELLIVMAIISVLVSLSIPAVMKAREASNRSACSNNLRQMGIACQAHQTQYNYLPTAGLTDYAAPTFGTNGSSFIPNVGWRQDAGWGYQILPFLDAEPIWEGLYVASTGSSATNVVNAMQNTIAPPLKLFFCPSRRQPSTNTTYTNPAFPYEAAYSSLLGKAAIVALSDYAGCNGTTPGVVPGNGAIVSESIGKFTVSASDIRDGTSYTLLLGEKAANPRVGFITNEDDLGYFSGYGSVPGSAAGSKGVNFNAVRFTSTALLPLRDIEITATTNNPTGGAFGSAHPGTWNALMADGSVQAFSYTINANVFVALGTIQGNEIISDIDLSN